MKLQALVEAKVQLGDITPNTPQFGLAGDS